MRKKRAGRSEHPAGGSVRKPFVLLRAQSRIALEKMFFFFLTLIQLSLSIISLLWVTHIIVSRASNPLKNWRLAFSVIEADFLPYFSYSHSAVGSPLKTQGTSHLLSACDIPHAALGGDSVGLAHRVQQDRRETHPAQPENTKASPRWRTTVFPEREWHHDWVTKMIFTIDSEIVQVSELPFVCNRAFEVRKNLSSQSWSSCGVGRWT